MFLVDFHAKYKTKDLILFKR